MSFQAYLDNVEAKTGRSPQEFIDMAGAKGLTRHADILDWLKTDYQLGTGHARAIAHIILHGPGTLEVGGKLRDPATAPGPTVAPRQAPRE